MFRMMHSLLLIMTLLTYNSCGSSGENIDLVSDGRSRYVIVVPDEATAHETKAARLLQDYLKRISGASLNIIQEHAYKEQAAIFIGNTEHAEDFNHTGRLKGESFYIATDKQHLYIRGGTGKGILYGVYTLLESYFGCRKYDAGPAIVPANKNLQLPQQLTDRQSPAFVYRETYYPPSFDDEYLEWHKLHRFEDLWGVWGHSLFKILPPRTYFTTHPEYYALVNGKRQASQLCLSNEGVFDEMVKYFRKAIAANPDALYWSVAAEDGGGFCTCDQCNTLNAAEGGPQGSLLRFVNRIAAVFPDKQFTTLAYQYTAHPPLKTKPAANVYIMLSSIDAYRDAPLSNAPSAAAFRKDLEDWGAVTDRIFVWDYTTQFTNYLTPFPDYNNLQPNMQYLSAHKVSGVFSQGSGDTYSDMDAYNSYIQAKLLWNPALTTEAITADFLNGYYGKAGPLIGQYMQALISTMRNTKTQLDIYGNPVGNYRDYLSPEAIDLYSSLLDKAEKAAEGNAVQLEKVNNARLPLEYTVLQQSRFFGADRAGYLVPDGNSYKVNPRWPERVRKFTAQCKAAGVKELSEGGGDADAYQKEWEMIFARKWVNSLAFGAKVSLRYPWSEDYPAKGVRTLTDGLQGDKDFSINWLFMYGQDLVATIDLGEEKTISEVQLNFLQDALHYIFNPADIIIESSANGTGYILLGQQQPAAEEDYTAMPRHYRFSFPPVRARFVRVTGRCLREVPAWRGAPPGKKAALCCDEIVVL